MQATARRPCDRRDARPLKTFKNLYAAICDLLFAWDHVAPCTSPRKSCIMLDWLAELQAGNLNHANGRVPHVSPRSAVM